VPVSDLDVKRVLRLAYRRQASLSYAAKAFLRTIKNLAKVHGPPFYFHAERAG
jgi:hypothetical protein